MPQRSVISNLVMRNMAIISGYDLQTIKDSVNQSLADDLGLTEDLRGALAPGFQKIARSYVPGAIVTKASCKRLKNTKAAIDLVFAQAGGKP